MKTLNKVRKIIDIVGIRETVVAMGLFAVGNMILAWLPVSDASERVEELEVEKRWAEETYLQVKSIDFSEISYALEKRAAELQEKRNRVFSSAWEGDSLPLLLSRIEYSAVQFGLKTISFVEDVSEPKKEQKTALPGSRRVRLNIEGSYDNTIGFIDDLVSWNEIFMVQKFTMGSENVDDNLLITEITIVIPELNADG